MSPPPNFTVCWMQFSLNCSPIIRRTYALPSLLWIKNLDSSLKICLFAPWHTEGRDVCDDLSVSVFFGVFVPSFQSPLSCGSGYVHSVIQAQFSLNLWGSFKPVCFTCADNYSINLWCCLPLSTTNRFVSQISLVYLFLNHISLAATYSSSNLSLRISFIR